MKKKKTIELNFVTFMIIAIIILVIVFIIARNTGNKPPEENKEQEPKQEIIEEKAEKLYSKDVITFDENKLSDKWKIIDKTYGSIIFYVQGPKKENDDGTTSDIRINIYIQKSEMTNEELKNQMLQKSVYSKVEYTKMQTINDVQWMEFEAENKGVKAKILTIMKDGYMYALEITGEEILYEENYNEAMKAVMTVQIAERLSKDVASNVIYKYDNLANIKKGGTTYLLTSLNLPKSEEQINEELPEEYKDYVFTGIKYDDFANELKKYMTEEIISKQFSEFVNYNGMLIMKNITNTQTEFMIESINEKQIKGKETTYEVVKTSLTTYETVKENITLKFDGEKCVVSNVE